MPLIHKEFLINLNSLRYRARVTEEQVEAALTSLAIHAAEFLPSLLISGHIQIDLVLGAAELWAFPFEACIRTGQRVFADHHNQVILTRRI